MKRTTFTATLFGIAVFALAACQADKASAPRPPGETPGAATVLPPVISSDVTLLIAGIDDAADRIAPALDDGAAAAELAPQLHLLSQALTARDTSRARAALSSARAALARAEPTPDAGAIGLALDRAEALLSAGVVDNPGPSPRSATPGDVLH